jgi:hypothetical protein
MSKTKLRSKKRRVIKSTKLLVTSLLALLFFSVIIYASSSGVTGRTNKSANPGCICHGPSASTGVSVTITGPDSIVQSSTANYTVTITGGPLSAAGVDIAASEGILAPVSGSLYLLNSELTHSTPKLPESSGAVVFNFTYTAPASPGEQFLYAVGNSVNSNNSTSGDEWNFAPNKTVQIISPTGIKDLNKMLSYKLEQNYPNPFNPITRISYSVAKTGLVTIKIYDILGTELTTLVNEIKQAGEYEVEFSAKSAALYNGNIKDLSSGIYFYRMQADNFVSTKKFVVLK